MRTVNIQKALIAGIALVFSSCAAVNDSRQATVSNEKTAKLNGALSIWRLIPAENIQRAIARSKEHKIILDLYPIKYSNDPGKNDFDLACFFQDAAEKGKNLSGRDNNFETQAAWYVDFLRDKKVPMNKVPLGYSVELNESAIKGLAGLNFFLGPNNQAMHYTSLKKDFYLFKRDSAGKCPPECISSTVLLLYDVQAAKEKSSLLHEQLMKEIISKSYKDKAYAYKQ